jgi:urea transporter
MNSIKLTAVKNTALTITTIVAGSVVTVLFLRFIVSVMKSYDVDPALGLAVIVLAFFVGAISRIFYSLEVARLETLERLNRGTEV